MTTAPFVRLSWSQQSGEGSDLTPATNVYCGRQLDIPPVTAWAVFSGQRKGRLFLAESVTQLDNERSATAAVQRIRHAHDGCSDWVSTNGTLETHWHTESLAAATIGDEAVIETASTQFEGLPSRSQGVFIFMRQGGIVLAMVEIGTDALDQAEPLVIARAADAKLRRVTAGMP